MQNHLTMKDGKQVYSQDGRVIGAVFGKVFCKTIQFSKHALRRPPAIACDDCALREAGDAGAERIRIKDIESGRVYDAPLKAFREHGLSLSRGFGNQTALPLGYWTVSDANGHLLQSPPPECVGVEQMALAF